MPIATVLDVIRNLFGGPSEWSAGVGALFAEIRCLNAEVLRSSVGANEIVVMVEVSTITTGLIEILSDLDSLAESQGPLPA
jgi:hypothetical protein